MELKDDKIWLIDLNNLTNDNKNKYSQCISLRHVLDNNDYSNISSLF